VLIVSASMGAGHDGAAKELAKRLESHGVAVDVVDYLASLPAGTGWFVRWFYGKQLSVAPRSYELLYATIERFRFAQHLCTFYTSTAKRALAKVIARQPYDAIVSTYPLASQTLGQLRHGGRLDTPLATVLTDFSVHTLWINQDIDLHMALHPETAALAKELGAPRVEVVEPLVAAKFQAVPPGRRALVRQQLGVAPGNRLVLIVAGSWGVGNVIGTVRELAGMPDLTPVVVCGRNEDLRRRLSDEPNCVALGWVDWMPELVASSDVLIQNAGGMTCLEAFASGVPVVSRNCIPGHGTANSVVLDQAGVAFHACAIPTLPEALQLLTPTRSNELVAAAYAMFGTCPTQFLVAEPAEIAPLPVPLNPARTATRRRRVPAGHDGGRVTRPPSGPSAVRPHRTRRRVAQGSAAFVLATGIGLQLVPVASAAGMGAAYRPDGSKSSIYVAIRPSDTSVAADWTKDLSAGHVTLAVDSTLLEAQRPLVQATRLRGVPVVLLAHGVLKRGDRNAVSGTALTHNGEIVAMADHHRIGAGDQFKAIWSDESLISPNHVVKASDSKLSLHGGDYVLIDGRNMTPQQVRVALAEVQSEAAAAGLTESLLPTASSSS
jgi:UDP-N-acetylglucosamine:LPS N-acetylglucosamine transferase